MKSNLPPPQILNIEPMTLLGVSARMSLAQNTTVQLWQGFMPRLGEISHRKSKDFISLQLFDPCYFNQFDPAMEFTKWAAVEVSDLQNIPDGFSEFNLNGGLYAVFHYKGMPGNPAIFHYIFSQWIPQSEFELDQRPHFEIMGSGYKNNSPESEEELYIPVKPRQDKI